MNEGSEKALGLEKPSNQARTDEDEAVMRRLTERIIGCAIEVHRELGPWLLEGTYEAALCIEFVGAGLSFLKQHKIPVIYKGHLIGEYKPDLIVEDAVVVEGQECRAVRPSI